MGKVFISSTIEDLESFRLEAKEAALERDMHPILCENWAASGYPPLRTCLEAIDALDPKTDCVVAIVARRHGWTPSDQPSGEYKSITRLECERAASHGIHIIPFLLDDKDTTWPECHEEKYRLVRAFSQNLSAEEIGALSNEIRRDEASHAEFKAWLAGEQRTRRAFKNNPDRFQSLVTQALDKWRTSSASEPPAAAKTAAPRFDERAYLDWVERTCEPLDLLGLDSKQPYVIGLRNVYIPAVTTEALARKNRGRDAAHAAALGERHALLMPVVGRASIYLEGAPGSGKSTFGRWLAFLIARGTLPPHGRDLEPPKELRESFPKQLRHHLPIVCSLRELANTHASGGAMHAPSAGILSGNETWNAEQFLGALATWADSVKPGGLDGGALRDAIAAGRCLLVLDGVDEIPTRVEGAGNKDRPRRSFLTGLAALLDAWRGSDRNRVILTSRPYGLSPADRRLVGLQSVTLGPIPTELQSLFVRRWFQAVDPERAKLRSEMLMQQLAEREDDGIREMPGNPMLLTALCVKFCDGAELPRDIFELYDKVIDRVLFGRYPDTIERTKVREQLAAIALGMHTGDEVGANRSSYAARVRDREVDLILRRLAESDPVVHESGGTPTEKREALLSTSGLLLPRSGKEVEFFHLSFQEFLAAERLQTQLAERRTTIPKILRQYAGEREWRRTLAFFYAADAQERRGRAFAEHVRVLQPHLERSKLRVNSNPAVVLADVVEIAHANGWNVASVEPRFLGACKHALDPATAPAARVRLWEVAGRVGFDRRPGVGLEAKTGLPDIVWCEVAGAETIELADSGGTQPVQPFAIAKYPVTHAQFQAFIDADNGYRNLAWWEEEWLRFVDLDRPPRAGWTAPNGPREMVNWFEAMAYCRWLTHAFRQADAIPEDRVVRLPTEFEWRCAASGGDPRRQYPWRGAFAKTKANTEEGGLGRTSPVGLYPDGDAACGASDMAGNVWEWCANRIFEPAAAIASEDTKAPRALRGGSWFLNLGLAAVGARGRDLPVDRNGYIGFRVCRASPIVDG